VKNLPLICKGASSVTYTEGVPETITISGGVGLCTGNLAGTYTATYSGSGTMTGAGYCEEDTDPPLVVQNLDILVDLTLTSTSTGQVVNLTEHWGAPVTIFPLITPFLAQENGSPVGAGYISTRIFLNCNPAGTPASTVFRVRLSPV